tara:strand:+ start:277 stop:645 length:369 start_codon:yes stop_codon:yes gene_type:complete
MSNSNEVVFTKAVIASKIEKAMLCLDFKVTTEKFGTIPDYLCDKRRKPTPAQIEAGRPEDDYYVSAEFLLNKLNERDEVESDHVITQREKARRIDAYRKQLETSQEVIFLTGNFEFNYIAKK